MSQPTFWDNVREFIAGIAFDVYLWASRMTVDEFREQIAHDIERGMPHHCQHGYNGLCPTCDAMNTPPKQAHYAER